MFWKIVMVSNTTLIRMRKANTTIMILLMRIFLIITMRMTETTIMCLMISQIKRQVLEDNLM